MIECLKSPFRTAVNLSMLYDRSALNVDYFISVAVFVLVRHAEEMVVGNFVRSPLCRFNYACAVPSRLQFIIFRIHYLDLHTLSDDIFNVYQSALRPAVTPQQFPRFSADGIFTYVGEY